MIYKDFVVVLSAVGDVETAARIARTLVEEGLMIAKTTAARLPACRERLVALHPYEVPEVVAVRLADGHHAYLRWVAAATRTPCG